MIQGLLWIIYVSYATVKKKKKKEGKIHWFNPDMLLIFHVLTMIWVDFYSDQQFPHNKSLNLILNYGSI